QAYTQAVLPDEIKFVDGPDVLLAGGNNYTIDLQLMLKGTNYSGNNFGIYFQTSNTLLVDIPPVSSIVSGADGRASYNITTGQGFGNVTITVALMSPDGNIRSAKTYLVTAYGNVSGTVVDASGNVIPDATVTLYPLENGEKGSALPVAGNPFTTSEHGGYEIENVPYGAYVVEAVIDGYNASTNLTVPHPTGGIDLTIAGYVAATPTPSPTPTPVPSEEPSPTVTPVPASPTPAGKTPTGDTTKQLMWIGGVALVLTVIIIGVQLLRQRKPKK
ncbi:MAG TPA: carboxypeptidase-like regulatory domain-containing protein, partial [Methanocella sp.]